jgi:hypothetical protein
MGKKKGYNKSASEEQSLIQVVDPRIAGIGDSQATMDPISLGIDRSIRIDLSRLRTPTNVYDADFAWIKHRPGAISFFFGKRSFTAKESLRTRLELRYPVENLVHHFWQNSRDFHARLDSFVSKWPKDVERDSLVPEEWNAERDHSEWANFETISHAGTEASLDFYLLPAFGIAQFMKGAGSSQLTIMPVVRVQMTAFELGRLLNSVGEIASEIEKGEKEAI